MAHCKHLIAAPLVWLSKSIFEVLNGHALLALSCNPVCRLASSCAPSLPRWYDVVPSHPHLDLYQYPIFMSRKSTPSWLDGMHPKICRSSVTKSCTMVGLLTWSLFRRLHVCSNSSSHPGPMPQVSKQKLSNWCRLYKKWRPLGSSAWRQSEDSGSASRVFNILSEG